jgi:hypothetical protein
MHRFSCFVDKLQFKRAQVKAVHWFSHCGLTLVQAGSGKGQKKKKFEVISSGPHSLIADDFFYF